MLPPPTVIVSAPSRLHFGLLSFGNPSVRQFGGVGVMIDQPGLRLKVSPAESLETAGPLQDRLSEAASRWLENVEDINELRCKVELTSIPRLHAGLGVGTQLALAVATGLNTFYERSSTGVEALARSVGRGLRSAVGTYGFALGGLIAEQGKLPQESVSPLIERVAMPGEWRFVLIAPKKIEGLHGANEQSAFDELPPVAEEVTFRLNGIIMDRILPAARSANYLGFSDAVYDFGFLAGSCFAPMQGGAYNGPLLSALVKQIRSLGVRGVGQSSWGPTIYAICESKSQADSLAENLRSLAEDREYEIMIASADNHGARVTIAASDL